MALHSFQTFTVFQNSDIRNSANLVEKLRNKSISENTIVSSFDVVFMYTNIDVAISEQILKNKIEEN